MTPTILLVLALSPAVRAAEPVRFRSFLDPELVQIAGNRRVGVEVPLAGRSAAELSVYLVYGSTRASLDSPEAPPVVAPAPALGYAAARCEDAGEPGWARCWAILPFEGNRAPNRLDQNPQVVPAGQFVVYRWHRRSGSSGPGAFSEARRARIPPPFTIVSMGDSYASGEGAPSPTGAKWEDVACHRSRMNGKRLAADALIAAHRDLEIRFGDFSCSGATVDDGILGAQEDVYDKRRNPAPAPQVQQASDWAASLGARIDMALLNIGGNDIGFAEIVTHCASPAKCINDGRRRTLTRGLADLGDPGGAYDEIGAELSARGVQAAFVSEVPDPTRDASGGFCGAGEMMRADALLSAVTENGSRSAFEEVVVPFNAVIRAAADRNGWAVIDGMVEATRTHGVCERIPRDGDEPEERRCNRRFFSTISCSLANQDGGPLGAFHPTRTGHALVVAPQTLRVAGGYLDGLVADAYARAAPDREPAILSGATAKKLSDYRAAAARRSAAARRRPLTPEQRAASRKARRAHIAEFRAAWGMKQP